MLTIGRIISQGAARNAGRAVGRGTGRAAGRGMVESAGRAARMQLILRLVRGIYPDNSRGNPASQITRMIQNMDIRMSADLNQFHKELESELSKILKASSLATTKEAVRLKKVLQDEIRKGAPGGRRFAQLSFIRRFYPNTAYRRKNMRRPLYRLASAVRYKRTFGSNSKYLKIEIGFTGNYRGSIRKLVSLHQNGGTGYLPSYSKEYSQRNKRISILRRGFSLKKQNNWAFRSLMLKKSTTNTKIPSRPIIEPFWNAHRDEAASNIKSNFQRKLNGERI